MESHTYQVSTNRPSNGLYIGNFHKKGITGPDSFAQLTWLNIPAFESTQSGR